MGLIINIVQLNEFEKARSGLTRQESVDLAPRGYLLHGFSD